MLVFELDVVLALCLGDTKHAESVEIYLQSRGPSNLKSEFQSGKGKMKVDCIMDMPVIELELGKHLFLSMAESQKKILNSQ